MSGIPKLNLKNQTQEIPIKAMTTAKHINGDIVVTLIYGKSVKGKTGTEDYINGVGPFIKERRTLKGFTLDDLAKRSGYNRSTILLIEKGRSVPVFRNMMEIFEALGTTLKDFVNYMENKK